MGLIEVGDIIVAKDKRLFLVTEVTLPYRKNSFDDNGNLIHSFFFETEYKLFNIELKKTYPCSSNRVKKHNELWIDVEIDKVIKHNDYSLEANTEKKSDNK